jgi:AcrR family transcriptional regulator
MARTIAKDHDEKRHQILKTAAKVFAVDGVDRASMSQVANACGISKANIYHYYDSKNALLFDILDTYLKDLRDRVCRAEHADLSPEMQFRRTVCEILLAYEGADDEHRVQASGIGSLPPEQQAVLRDYQRDLVSYMGDRLCALAPGRFSADRAQLRSVTMSVFGMLNWYYMWNSRAGSQERRRYADLVADMVLKGISGI